MTATDFHTQFQLYQNPNPSKYEFSKPRSSYYSMKGQEVVIFWGVAIVVIIGLMIVLKSLYRKK
jgi:hypothetical protein